MPLLLAVSAALRFARVATCFLPLCVSAQPVLKANQRAWHECRLPHEYCCKLAQLCESSRTSCLQHCLATVHLHCTDIPRSRLRQFGAIPALREQFCCQFCYTAPCSEITVTSSPHSQSSAGSCSAPEYVVPQSSERRQNTAQVLWKATRCRASRMPNQTSRSWTPTQRSSWRGWRRPARRGGGCGQFPTTATRWPTRQKRTQCSATTSRALPISGESAAMLFELPLRLIVWLASSCKSQALALSGGALLCRLSLLSSASSGELLHASPEHCRVLIRMLPSHLGAPSLPSDAAEL